MDQLSVIRVNQILSQFISARGLTPVVTDLSRADAYPRLLEQAQSVSGGASFAQIVDSTPLANFTAEAAFTAPTPSDVQFTFPAGALNSIGRLVRFKAWGTLASVATPTYTLSARLGGLLGSLIGVTHAILAAANSTAAPWMIEGEFIVRAIGALGVIQPSASLGGLANAASGPAAPLLSLGNGSVAPIVAFNTTLARTLVFTAACSAANAANAIRMTGQSIEVLR